MTRASKAAPKTRRYSVPLSQIGSNENFIRAWWKRRFHDAKPPKWDSAITCADAADLLMNFRIALRRRIAPGRGGFHE